MKPIIPAAPVQTLVECEWSLRELDRLVAQALPPLAQTEDANLAPEPGPVPGDDQATRLRTLVVDVGPARPATAPSPARAHTCAAPPTRPPAHAGARVVVIASGKGGVGKTTLSVNLAIALAQRGIRVTLLDADFGTANADVICGLAPHARLDHVFMPGAGGEKWNDGAPRTLRDIAVRAPGGFRLIPGTTGVARMADLSVAERAAIVTALHELDADTDVLLIDAGAGVGKSVTAFMAAADLSVVVATPEPTAIADAYALIKCALAAGPADDQPDEFSKTRVALVMNQVLDGAEGIRVHARIRAVCDRFLGVNCPLLGCVAQDVRVPEAVRAREPVLLRAPASQAGVHMRVVAGELARRLGVGHDRAVPNASVRGVAALVRRLLGKPGVTPSMRPS